MLSCRRPAPPVEDRRRDRRVHRTADPHDHAHLQDQGQTLRPLGGGEVQPAGQPQGGLLLQPIPPQQAGQLILHQG